MYPTITDINALLVQEDVEGLIEAGMRQSLAAQALAQRVGGRSRLDFL